MVYIVANISVLMRLARELGQARLSGDEKRIQDAQERHDAYHRACLKADELRLS